MNYSRNSLIFISLLAVLLTGCNEQKPEDQSDDKAQKAMESFAHPENTQVLTVEENRKRRLKREQEAAEKQ